MKIVLFALNSSFVHTNLAIRCLKDYIDKNSLKKHDVLLVEKNHKDKFDEILHSLHECNADLYGFSCYIFNIDEIIQIAKSLKKLLPN
ncbi:MAG TPA: B12-binding domain-containing radical SAM protein, partial [Clostridia bacterium]|nr:B12-binding domain-containing radical SAM protein [Clostridia bacterium]